MNEAKEAKDLSMIATEQTLTGTSMLNWLRLLWENKFKLSLKYLHKILLINIMIIFSTPFIWFERIFFTHKIKKTEINKPPIFIIGHWRSGTTYLHLLLTQDKQFGFCSNLQSFMPHVFLGSKWLFGRIVADAMPEKRRQDNFVLGIDLPSEEEFGVGNMCPIGFYHGLSFPNNRYYYANYNTFKEVPQKKINKWKKTYRFFLQKLTYAAKGKQLVLKNPPNTSRIKYLLEMFPDAKFIHIYRNPYEVFRSTNKMYFSLVPPFFLQVANTDSADEIVLYVYEEMHRKFFEEKHLIPKENYIEVRYEEFLQDPLASVENIYKTLSLPDFDVGKDAFKGYIAEQASYKMNVHTYPKEVVEKVSKRWKQTIEEWGYSLPE